MKLKVGDNIMVIAGKDRGKTGIISKLFVKATRVMVDGINIVKKHVKPSKDQKGGIIEMEKSVHASNVMLVCPTTGKPTRISYQGTGKDKVRVSKKSGKVIPNVTKKK